MSSISAVIIDDHALFAEGLKALLGHCNQPVIKVIGASGDVERMLILIEETRPTLVFLDLNLGSHNGIDLVKPIKEDAPDTKIIIISAYGEEKFVREAFKSGIDGYILKGARFKELNEGIVEVMNGNLFFGEGVRISQRNKNGTNNDNNTPYRDSFIMKHRLTKREIEVLTLITKAFSNKEIAQKLYISDQTVSVHRKNLMRKLGVSNTVSLIRMAQDLRLP